MLTPFLIAALLAAPAQASLSLASPDLAELLRRETESAAERNLWLTFRTGQLATARRAFQRGQYRKSLQLLERWLKRHPKAESVNPVRFLSASAELRLKRHERCAESFQRLAADYPALRDASCSAWLDVGSGRDTSPLPSMSLRRSQTIRPKPPKPTRCWCGLDTRAHRMLNCSMSSASGTEEMKYSSR